MIITLYSVGKNKEQWLEEACSEYIKRLTPDAIVQTEWLRDDQQLIKATSKEKRLLCLDPLGKEFTSEQFSKYLIQELENSGARLGFVIGGPLGLPKELKEKHPLISLSKMTFTHQCTRLILLEQIYRSFEIAKGSPYHK